MDTFRRLFIVAALAGLISGGFITVVHQVSTSRIILAAEVFENAAEPAAESATAGAAVSEATEGHDHSAHDHGAAAWAPEDGAERILYTAMADVLIGIAYALLLVAAYRIWGGQMNWRSGLYWGFAGFVAIVLSPNLGLPPEVPGTEAAPLLDRQVWWAATAILTAGGLALIFFGKRSLLAVLGLVLIILPHAYGAPQPAEYASVAPEALEHRFIVAATITGLLFWAALGASTGYFYRRFLKDAAA
ncbi:MAG: CbtA family protein [Proteobacteria bacterium]|nr:CbtA family protein [Pseudomonadota bacterium]